jgi:hypothetical protein
MSSDDEEILAQLVVRLDIDSAISALRKIGFYGIKINGGYHMYRIHPRDSASIEELEIAMTSKNYFNVTWNKGGRECIQTWDQWLDFVGSINPGKKRC